MDTLIPVNLTIADRSYRVKVQPKDEEVLRRTIKLINDKIVEFKTHFAGKDMQDYIAMVLIWFATEENAGGVSDLEKETLLESLNNLEKMIS